MGIRLLLFLSTLTLTPGPAGAAVRYVNLANASPAPPYTTWATAATTIQEAVDAAVAGDEVVVTNGVYATGGRVVHGALTNRVAVNKPLTVQSVNGPAVTVIQGYQVPGTKNGDGAVRCVYLTNGAVLVGFTLTTGATRTLGDPFHERTGGGVWCESDSAAVSNCVLTGNSAYDSGGGACCGTLNNCALTQNSATGQYGNGGGAYRSTLIGCVLDGNAATGGGGGAYLGFLQNCVLTRNAAGYSGGGASGFTCVECAWFPVKLINCTLAANSAGWYGGGVSVGNLENCILLNNTASEGWGRNYSDSWLTSCCTTPLYRLGLGNIDLDPLFVDRARGDFRLQANSPCINSGRNADAPAEPDLAGHPRVSGGTVDIGAYEFQNPASTIPYAWLQQYALPIDASTDTADPDVDRLNNWQEWRAGTDPTNALSALRLLTPVVVYYFYSLVTWQSVPGRAYTLERIETLGGLPLFVPVATGISAASEGNSTSYFDFVEEEFWPATRFYRVKVE